MVHAEATAPFVLKGEQYDALADFKFRVRFVTGIARPQIFKDLLDRLVNERAGIRVGFS